MFFGMDCCNYMQYRHHQPYYHGGAATQYYDHHRLVPSPTPYHHADFYGQPMYHEYYAPPYYHQQWAPVPPQLPDYVYNPKEARIRKALREAATRDRTIGASPMLPSSSNSRLTPHNWTPQDQLMMAPMGGMRNSLDVSVCSFPLSGNNGASSPYMPSISDYGKMESPMQPNVPLHSNYMQPSPLAQLQQQTEMWHSYQDSMRPKSIGNSFMMTQIPPYHQPEEPIQDVPTNLIVEKPSTPIRPISTSASSNNSPRASENVIPLEKPVVTPPQEQLCQSNQANKSVCEPQDFLKNGNDENVPIKTEPFTSQHFPESVVASNPFEKCDSPPIKKAAVTPPTAVAIPRSTNKPKKPSNKALPDFNEAFGSTERGRYLSPPDPRLAPNKGYLDYYFDANIIKFDEY